jgi:hypothetical protein
VSSSKPSSIKNRLSVFEYLKKQLEAELGPETGRGIRHALQLKYGVHSRALSRLSMSRSSRTPHRDTELEAHQPFLHAAAEQHGENAGAA